MLQAGNLCACVVDMGKIDVGSDDRGYILRLSKHQPPRVDDHRAAKALPVGRVMTNLSSRYNVAKVLNGACAKQDFPVIASGMQGETSRYKQDLCSTQG